MHVTLKLDEGLPSLRDSELLPVVKESLRQSKQREGFRLVHYSVQEHHLHLIVEARDAQALSRGMQGLAIRVAKRIHRALGTRGRVFIDRYHAHVLKTPTDTRAALLYVLNNVRHHARQRGERLAGGWVDDRSSRRTFDGLTVIPGRTPARRARGDTCHRRPVVSAVSKAAGRAESSGRRASSSRNANSGIQQQSAESLERGRGIELNR